MRIGILASHDGSTMQAIVDACKSGALEADPVVVISNNPGSGVLRRAEREGITSHLLNGRTHPAPEDLDLAILEVLMKYHVDLVALAGYMKKLGPETLRQYRGRILNSHPALLPRFGGKGMYGDRVHRAVLAAGESVAGATVHLVTKAYDEGPIVSQVRVPVHAGDTLESLRERVQAAERRLYVDVLRAIAGGHVPG